MAGKEEVGTVTDVNPVPFKTLMFDNKPLKGPAPILSPAQAIAGLLVPFKYVVVSAQVCVCTAPLTNILVVPETLDTTRWCHLLAAGTLSAVILAAPDT